MSIINGKQLGFFKVCNLDLGDYTVTLKSFVDMFV